jgi:hypothetical protein
MCGPSYGACGEYGTRSVADLSFSAFEMEEYDVTLCQSAASRPLTVR